MNATALARRHPWWVAFGLACLGLGLLKSHTFLQPPVWDTAMGVVPPAIWLHRHGFDIATLVELPAWQDGGPNIYSLSLVTWLTAFVIRLTGGTMAWLPAMHIIHLLVAAAGLATLNRIALRALGMWPAALVTIAVALLPLFSTQAGYLYLEMPLAAATLAALDATARSHHGAAAAWATVAMAVKPTGLVIVAVVGFVALVERAPITRRLARAAIAAIGPVIILALNLWAGSKKGTNPWHLDYWAYVTDCYHRMRTMPDVLAMLGFASFVAVGSLPRTIASVARPAGADSAEDPAAPSPGWSRDAAVCALAVGAFVGFVLAVPLSGMLQPLLPRHLVQVVPAMFVCSAAAHSLLLPRRIIVAGGVALAAIFVANSAGRFYPVEHLSFAVAERSDAYRDFLAVQRSVIEAAAKLPADVDVFYPLPDHYFMSDPLLGYIEKPLQRGHCLRFEDPWRRGRLADFPDRFFLLDSNAYHGGEALAKVVRQAEADRGHRVIERRRIVVGAYSARILEVRRL